MFVRVTHVSARLKNPESCAQPAWSVGEDWEVDLQLLDHGDRDPRVVGGDRDYLRPVQRGFVLLQLDELLLARASTSTLVEVKDDL